MKSGDRLGPYEVVALVGSGGMGEVYKARDTRLGRDVAIKVLPARVAEDPDRRTRFEREARAVAALNHPGIVTLYSLEEVSGRLLITMELVEGETVAAAIARRRMSLLEAARLVREVADAIGYAHAHGILHRDLKPANLMLSRDGHVKVLDFGLAKLRSGVLPPGLEASTMVRLTSAQAVVGTPEYLSPEQAEGRPVDERSDIFSLGIILYELTAGRRPFTGGSALAVVTSILRDTPPPITESNPEAPPKLAEIVRRCLAKDPRSRYQSARELGDELDTLVERWDISTPAAAGTPVGTPAAPARRSVAVLPFLNLSSDPENEFFADGITEDVIAQLSKMRSLKVISRTSAMQFKKREQTLGEIAARLGVATLVEGSVRKAGDRVRIVAELLDAATDELLWSETYDRQLNDIFAIQSDVALRIADALKAELSPSERARVEQATAINIDAYQLFLKARQSMGRVTEKGLQAALGDCERALAMEPRYAPGHELIAWIYIILGMGHGAGTLKPREAHARAREAALLALECDPLYGPAYGTLGSLQFMVDYDWAGAEQSLKRGLELSPGNAGMLDAYGLLLSGQLRFDEAIAVQKRARALDPLSTMVASDLATALLRAGRHEEAVAEARSLVERDPAYPLGHSTLGWGCLFSGRVEKGLAELRAAVSLSPENTLLLAQLGEAYGLLGHRDRTLEILSQLEQMARERYVTPYHFAYVYTGLRENDKALDALEQAFEERSGGVYGIKGSFLFTTLREHPRFSALLRKMNLDNQYATPLSGSAAARPQGASA